MHPIFNIKLEIIYKFCKVQRVTVKTEQFGFRKAKAFLQHAGESMQDVIISSVRVRNWPVRCDVIILGWQQTVVRVAAAICA